MSPLEPQPPVPPPPIMPVRQPSLRQWFRSLDTWVKIAAIVSAIVAVLTLAVTNVFGLQAQSPTRSSPTSSPVTRLGLGPTATVVSTATPTPLPTSTPRPTATLPPTSGSAGIKRQLTCGGSPCPEVSVYLIDVEWQGAQVVFDITAKNLTTQDFPGITCNGNRNPGLPWLVQPTGQTALGTCATNNSFDLKAGEARTFKLTFELGATPVQPGTPYTLYLSLQCNNYGNPAWEENCDKYVFTMP